MQNIEKLYDFVQEKCKNYDLLYGHTDVWKYHIKIVVENALVLAKMYGADEEIVEIAALLHDIASLEDFGKYEENHHIVGAEMAEDILNTYGLSSNKIELVKKCILNHRASKLNDKHSIEEICVADADAISHVLEVVELIVWKAKQSLNVEEISLFVKNKITKSYNKMSEKSKTFYRDKFERTISIFD